MFRTNRHTLDNGLRLVHYEDVRTQMVALNIVYDVGARDEHPQHTGFAHLFEHLMFGGSVHIPDYDTPLQLAGGENNAWTNNDITNYYLTMPKANVETGFWLESDRMLGLDFGSPSLEVQREVVMEEFKQRCLNQPYGDVGHLLRPLAYQVHPYRWPTIGKELSHIAQATLPEVEEFFYRYYAPNNAVLAVTGHISWDETLRFAEKWFASVPRRCVPERCLPAEPEQQADQELPAVNLEPVAANDREQVARRAPDVVLIYDYLDPSVESKIATLRATPAVAGLPALSVPAGLADGLPLAVQLVGRPGSERALLAAARACEIRPARPRAD